MVMKTKSTEEGRAVQSSAHRVQVFVLDRAIFFEGRGMIKRGF